jgi:aryl-alcohol dehydrogenase-like predicted oxidoreductase
LWGRLATEYGQCRPVSIQNSYSLLNRVDYETHLAETCAPNNCNVGLMAYSPLAGGMLSGKYLSPGADRFNFFCEKKTK